MTAMRQTQLHFPVHAIVSRMPGEDRDQFEAAAPPGEHLPRGNVIGEGHNGCKAEERRTFLAQDIIEIFASRPSNGR